LNKNIRLKFVLTRPFIAGRVISLPEFWTRQKAFEGPVRALPERLEFALFGAEKGVFPGL